MLLRGSLLSVRIPVFDQKDVINVIHLIVSLEAGGAERVVVDLANGQNRRDGYSASIICLDKLGALAGEIIGCEAKCLNAVRYRLPWDFAAVRELLEAINVRRKAEIGNSTLLNNSGFRSQVSDFSSIILHAHNMAAWQYAVLASIGAGVKVVYTQHGANIHNRGFKNRLRSIILSWFTDRIVAVSENTAEEMVKNQGIPCRRIKVVRNGIDITGLQPRTCPAVVSERGRSDADENGLKEEIGISLSSFVIGSVGRLDYVKGYDVLISAFATLVKKQVTGDESALSHSSVSPMPRFSGSPSCVSQSPCPPVLLLVGDGPERENLENQAKTLGIAEQVIFAGYQGDVVKYMKAMDVFVLPSRSEGLSISLLEACANGLPVVATNAGGNTEVIKDGMTGMVVPSGDERALGEGIGKMLSDAGLRQRTGEAAQKLVCEHFSIEKAVEEYEKLYRLVCRN